MMRWLFHPSIVHIVFAAIATLPTVAANGWNREECLANITASQNSTNSSMTLNPAFFFPESIAANPVLTVDGCEALCGDGMGIYSDSAPRLITWFLPIILLVANMQFANIGKKRFWMVLHLLGDPIDSTWSILSKVADWNRCYSVVRVWYEIQGKRQGPEKENQIKNLVILLSVAEELFEPFSVNEFLNALARTGEDLDAILYEYSSALRDGRTKEIIRTAFAIIFYIFQVVSAFVPAVGEASSPSGGRIGPAMLLSWLLSVVLLSNAVGDFAPRRQCKWIITHFLKRIGQRPDPEAFCAPKSSRLRTREVLTPHFESLDWSGAIYAWRPSKSLLQSPLLAFVSLLPTTFAFGTAFAVLDTAPTYFSCRHLLVIGVYISWLCSAVFTFMFSMGSSHSIATGKYLWHIILVKDTIIAVLILAFIVASGCGMMNSCYCFSGALVLGRNRASVPLNPQSAFDRNNHVIYPAMVLTGVGFQLCVFAIMVWVGWHGFKVMWWRENEIREMVPHEIVYEIMPEIKESPPGDTYSEERGEVRMQTSLDIELELEHIGAQTQRKDLLTSVEGV